MRRRRGKAHGQVGSGWDDQQRNRQREERNFYGNRQYRFRVSTDWYDDDWYGSRRGAVVHLEGRSSHESLVRRQDVVDEVNQRRRNIDSDAGKVARGFSDKGADKTAFSQYKRFVTFYFTNFLPQLSNFFLQKGFEVCGLLEEVVVPSRRNANGEVYGFVRFSKVRDVGKLLKAVNAVCFSNYRVRAKIARFDRNVGIEGKLERDGAEVRELGKPSGDGSGVVVKKKVGDEGNMVVSRGEGTKQADEGVKVVRVGEVHVQGREGMAKGGIGSSSKVLDEVRKVGKCAVPAVGQQQPVSKKLVQMYRSNGNDLNWAKSGVLATVVNGEATTVIQNRVEDAGFVNLDVILMGADRVFLKSTSYKDTLSVLEETKDFFDLIFSNIVRWDKDVVPFRRGAWLRLYCIPIHAWNENFFQTVRDGLWDFPSIRQYVVGQRKI